MVCSVVDSLTEAVDMKRLHPGLIAGINAAMSVLHRDPLILDRSKVISEF